MESINLPDIVPGQVKYTVNKEANDRGGPGNAGKIAPTMPVRERSIAISIIIPIKKVIVIEFCLVQKYSFLFEKL